MNAATKQLMGEQLAHLKTSLEWAQHLHRATSRADADVHQAAKREDDRLAVLEHLGAEMSRTATRLAQAARAELDGIAQEETV